jgi:hypothetical protein
MKLFPLVSFKEHGHDMFIYWMGQCDEVDSKTERKIELDKSNFY